MHDVLHIQKQSYIIDGFNTTFTVEPLPSDMKWLSTVAGELNNAAYHFSPFGNVNSDNNAITNGSLGEDPSYTWHPWDYEERIQVVKKQHNYSSTTKRNKLLSLIREQGYRQKYEPLLGKLVDCGYTEPLHNSNNSWAYLHALMLEIALAKSGVTPSCKQIDDFPPNSPFAVFITVLKEKLRVARLAKK